jgi:hypothetical protein
VQSRKLVQAHGANAFNHVRLNDAAFERVAECCAHVQRRMRPGRLRQVLDADREPRFAFDQEHVAGPQAGSQVRRVGWQGHPMRMTSSGQEPGQRAPEPGAE